MFLSTRRIAWPPAFRVASTRQISARMRGARPSLASSSKRRRGLVFCAQDPHDRGQRRGLTHAVAPEQRHDLAGSDGEFDAEQDPAVAIPGFEPANLKHWLQAPPARRIRI